MDANTIRVLINTLNRIQVSGEDNMNMMLGSIQMLRTELRKEEEKEAPKDDDVADAAVQ